MSSNPFAPFVARMDDLVPRLESNTLDDTNRAELVDLIRRAMFFIVNHVNTQANSMQVLILPVEGEVIPDDTDTQDQPEGDARSAGQTAVHATADPSVDQPETPE